MKKNKEYSVQEIRNHYIEKEDTPLDALRKLDAKVKRPATAFTYTFGSVGALIMGSGMSLIMTDIAPKGNSMLFGVIIGTLGMAMAILNYPIYKHILNARRREYSQAIIDLSDKIMKDE